MARTLDTLPTEILSLILWNLCISDLLSLSATSRTNQILAHNALHTLDLAIFSRRGQVQTAFLTDTLLSETPGAEWVDDEIMDLRSLYQIGKTTQTQSRPGYASKHQTEAGPIETLAKQISEQNQIALAILTKPALQHLQRLTLRMYEMTSADLTDHLARSMPKLRVLNLKFFHRTVKEVSISDQYWRAAPKGTPIWNALAGVGDINNTSLKLKDLRELSIERAGITGTQLLKWIEANPRLTRLVLSNVKGVDFEFVDWLSNYASRNGSSLKEIRLENCPQLVMSEIEHCSWLNRIATGKALRTLSLWQCPNVQPRIMDLFLSGNQKSFEGLELFVSPAGSIVRHGVPEGHTENERRRLQNERRMSAVNACIEVDPAYEVRPLTASL